MSLCHSVDHYQCWYNPDHHGIYYWDCRKEYLNPHICYVVGF